MEDRVSLIYVTAPDEGVALALAKSLVEARLVACANLLGAVRSLYWWDGKVNDEPEVAMVFKTRSDLVEAVTKRVLELHPYSCPCVVTLPVSGGNPAFMQWIAAETTG